MKLPFKLRYVYIIYLSIYLKHISQHLADTYSKGSVCAVPLRCMPSPLSLSPHFPVYLRCLYQIKDRIGTVLYTQRAPSETAELSGWAVIKGTSHGWCGNNTE